MAGNGEKCFHGLTEGSPSLGRASQPTENLSPETKQNKTAPLVAGRPKEQRQGEWGGGG